MVFSTIAMASASCFAEYGLPSGGTHYKDYTLSQIFSATHISIILAMVFSTMAIASASWFAE